MPTSTTEPQLPTRVLLLTSAVLHPLLHPMVTASWPDDWDPLSVRLLLSLLSALGLAATWHPTLRRHSTTVTLAVACVIQVWYLHIGHVNGLIVERGLNTVMVLIAGLAVLRRSWQVGVYLVVTSTAVAWGYAGPQGGAIPQFGIQTTVWVIGGASALVIHYRSQLEQALAHQTAHTRMLSMEVDRRKHAEQEAMQASRAKSAFLAHMSHELRTPLTAILGYGELVEEELVGTDAEEFSGDVDRILVSARHLLGLIDEVLDLARIESGKVELRPESVDLSVVVEGCLDLVTPAAVAGNNTLRRSVAPGVRSWGDSDRIRQVVLNLLSNALKFTDAGTVSVEVRRIGDRAVLTVSDTGCGIPEDAIPTLFDPFVRVDEQREGTGLGLAISRELVHQMGGSLRVRSFVGEGSVFTAMLPVLPPGAAQRK